MTDLAEILGMCLKSCPLSPKHKKPKKVLTCGTKGGVNFVRGKHYAMFSAHNFSISGPFGLRFENMLQDKFFYRLRFFGGEGEKSEGERGGTMQD